MAYEACELAELARAAVPVGEHDLNVDGTTDTPGAALAHAARVLVAARRFLEAAAVFERVGGADWRRIGEVLAVSPGTARLRFATSEARFRELLSPGAARSDLASGEVTDLRAFMAREPLEIALDLDDWVLRHEDGDSHFGAAPVSGGLVQRPTP